MPLPSSSLPFPQRSGPNDGGDGGVVAPGGAGACPPGPLGGGALGSPPLAPPPAGAPSPEGLLEQAKSAKRQEKEKTQVRRMAGSACRCVEAACLTKQR